VTAVLCSKYQEAALPMAVHDSSHYKDLTSEHLFNLMLDLPQNTKVESTLDNRACSRWRLRSGAELHYRAADGKNVTERVSIRDISMSGVGLVCGDRVPEGIPGILILPLEDGCYKIGLLVAYCSRTVEGFRVGCRLQLPDAPRLVPMISRAMSTQERLEQ